MITQDYRNVQELLQTGAATQGQLLIPRKIYDSLIDEVEYAKLDRALAAIVVGPSGIPGSSIDFNLVTPNSAAVRIVGEGAQVPLDSAEYTNTNVKPDKYGITIKITGEFKEDSQFNLLEHNIKYAGKKFAENETSIIISQALDSAGNTVSGGATLTIANITTGMFNLEQNDFMPTDLIVGNEAAQDLRNIDTFAEADKFGSNEMQTKGFIGRIYGMNVHRVSTNAGMTRTTSYIIDRSEAYAIVEKRSITVENFDLPTHDLSGVTITQRIRTVALRTNAICNITTS